MRIGIPEQYVTIQGVAKFLCYSTRTVRRLVARGDIPAYYVGGSLRFILSEVHQAVQRKAGRARRRRKVAKIPVKDYSSHPEALSTQTKGGAASG